MIISFEGIDGCGKSTQVELLSQHLSDAGHKVRRIREPGGTPLSEQVREILLDTENEIVPFAEMLLFSAARSQLCRTVLKEWQENGDIILCDRFFDSTIAYQGGGRAVAESAWLSAFQRQVTGGLIPERTYYFRVDIGTAESRKSTRHDPSSDRMEIAGSEFFERVIDAYDILAREEPDRICVIDARQDIRSVFSIVQKDADQLLKESQSAGNTGTRISGEM